NHPFLPFTLLADPGADLWWGFHLLLLPLTPLGNVWGSRIAGALIAAALAGTMAYLIHRGGQRRAAVFALLPLVASPVFAYRDHRPSSLGRVPGRFPACANCWRRRFLHSFPCTPVLPALPDLRAAGSSGFLPWLAALRAARCSPASRREGNFVVHRRSGSGLASATRSSRVSFRRIQDFYGGLGCDEHGSIAARSISACTHFPA